MTRLTIPELHEISADLLPHIDTLRIRRIVMDTWGVIELDMELATTPTEAAVALLAAYDMWDGSQLMALGDEDDDSRQVYVKGTYRGAGVEHCKIYHDESSIRLIDAYGSPDRALLVALAGDPAAPRLSRAEQRDQVWAACAAPAVPAEVNR